MTFEEIHTERLILRSLTQEVYDHVFSVFSEDALLDFLEAMKFWKRIDPGMKRA